MADESVYKFSIIPYSKEVLDRNHQIVFKYFFSNGAMSSVNITTSNASGAIERELIIKRSSGLAQVYNSDNTMIMSCAILNENNILIDVMHLPSKFFATVEKDTLIIFVPNIEV
jgi:hypothetical protein